MDRAGWVNPGTGRRRSRPSSAPGESPVRSRAGAGVELRAAGLRRPVRSMTLVADEDASRLPSGHFGRLVSARGWALPGRAGPGAERQGPSAQRGQCLGPPGPGL